MSEFPDRPDLDQLRRQARELLRAAADGEPRAITRLRAVSERVTLSAAQLAIAREHGCPSWPALGAEVQRRRRLSESAGRQLLGGDVRGPLDAPEDRWSFGGGTAMETSAGLLFPEALVVGAGHAVLDASLMPSGNGEPATARPRRPLVPETQLARWVPRRARATRRARRRRADAAVATMRSLARPDEVTVIDDRGARYALHPGGMSGKLGPSGEPAGPMSVRLRLDPVPRREVRWLELTGPCINRPQPASDLSQPPRSLQKVQSLPNPQQLAVAGGLGNGPGVRCHSSVMSKSASSRNLNWNSQPRCRIHRARPRTQPGQAGIHGPLPARHARRATRHGSGHQRLTDDLRIQTHKSLSSK